MQCLVTQSWGQSQEILSGCSAKAAHRQRLRIELVVVAEECFVALVAACGHLSLATTLQRTGDSVDAFTALGKALSLATSMKKDLFDHRFAEATALEIALQLQLRRLTLAVLPRQGLLLLI